MVKTLSDKIKHISESVEEEKEYITGRKNGTIVSLAVPWKKYRQVCMGGIEWYTIHTIGGMSGSGKTAIINELETQLSLMNPKEDIEVLSFNFEMISRNLVARKVSKGIHVSTQELHSGLENQVLSHTDYEKAMSALEPLKTLPIYYVEEADTVEGIRETIMTFAKRNPKKGLVMLLDHTILVEGKQTELERIILVNLMKMLNGLKKYFYKSRKKFACVLLSQMNREIEKLERTGDPGSQNFPTKRDIFGGDAVWQFSDVVMVSMNPFQMGMDRYGPKSWETEGFLYWHYLKVREGAPVVAKMVNNLKYNTVTDYIMDANQSKFEL